tara:strand:+ start:534 stop:740 length:207 start_codon:yes stop_codon:yes gene_type:complete
MQKFLSMAEVQAIIDPEKEMFTREELIAIKVSMQFIQEKFYWQEEDKKSNTYKQLITIRDKCVDALEK